MTALDAAQRELDALRRFAGAPREPRLGCVRTTHATFGFCAFCIPTTRGGLRGIDLEVNAWRAREIVRGLEAATADPTETVRWTLADRLTGLSLDYYADEIVKGLREAGHLR